MIFRRISYRIALQFTGFVFGLLLVTGTLFLAGDMVQRHRMTSARLERQLEQLLSRPGAFGTIPPLPAFQRERIRITDAEGTVLFSGLLFADVPFAPKEGISTTDIGRESYDILTSAFRENGTVIGYLQVADRSVPDDVGERVVLFLLVSAGISVLTFGVGLFFARSSLKPAEQMMDRLEQFTQDASHELRTPLTAISTSLDLAASSGDPLKHIAGAKRNLKDVVTLVERLLELARLDSLALQRESVNITDLVTHVLETHEHAAKNASIVITRDVAPDVSLYADPALLRQVVDNLVSNAIKFNHPNGTVTVRLTKNGLSVQNTGKGIAAESLPHVFDRFYREDRARTNATDGLGLGLALTKRIVDLHGWSIIARSSEKDGTHFTVKF